MKRMHEAHAYSAGTVIALYVCIFFICLSIHSSHVHTLISANALTLTC